GPKEAGLGLEGLSHSLENCPCVPLGIRRLSHHFSEEMFGLMSLNNNNPVNNEGQGSSNGSGKRAEHKGRYKGLGFPGANHEHSDQVVIRRAILTP
ncbi:MAG: hypothetical protein WCC42_07980, partial [Pseudolabrys sp.]